MPIPVTAWQRLKSLSAMNWQGLTLPVALAVALAACLVATPAQAQNYITTNSSNVFQCKQTGAGTTIAAPIGEFTAAGAPQAWNASDILNAICLAIRVAAGTDSARDVGTCLGRN